jgi:LPXTG-motif cell wall-anchored protein
MRPVTSIVTAAGLGLATLVAAASPALASNSGGGSSSGSGSGSSSGAASAASVTISPSTVQPGDCSAYSNPKPTWRSTSAFSSPVSLSPMSGQPGFFSGTATVSASIQSGSYTVSGACSASAGNSQFQGDLEVGSADDGSGYRMPQGNAHTGVGGSITGGDTTSVAAGGVLLAGAGLLTLRRRRTRDGH